MADERRYHTRVGWWLMSNPRAFSALFGATAAGLFVAVSVYTVGTWTGFSASFGHGVLLGAATTVSGSLVARAAPRHPAASSANSILVALLAMALLGASWIGGRAMTGLLCGVAGTGSLAFAAVCAWWLTRQPAGDARMREP